MYICDNDRGQNLQPLQDMILVTYCHTQEQPERDRIMVCLKNTAPTAAQIAASKQILRKQQQQQQRQHTPHSGASSHSFEDDLRAGFGDAATTRTTRPRSNMPPSAAMSTASTSSSTSKRMSQVEGFRPPSQYISRNLKSLQEFFPEAGPQVLRKTIRNSQIYTKRMSRMSRISNRSSIAMFLHESDEDLSLALGGSASPSPPPVPALEDYYISPVSGVGPGFVLPTGSSNAQTQSRLASSSSSSSRERPSSHASVVSLEEKTLPPVPSPITQAPPSHAVSRRASNMSLVSARSSTASGYASQSDLQNTLTPAVIASEPADIPESEEEFVELFQREQSGPSRWIKGSLIGAGSFGTVYLGLNSITGELMAVKQVELLSDKGAEHEQRKKSMIDALQREMSLLRDLQHPNIVQYLGSNCENNYLNIFLEYVPGGSVSSILASYGRFEEVHIRSVVKQILHGLKYLHSRSIIHRDIKGANVLMDNKGMVKISDFGISKKLEDKNARASLQGSVYWMAPEVVKQKPYTFKADIWSLGCLIVEMYTGSRPFPGFQHLQALFNIGNETPVPPEIPPNASPEGEDFLRQAFEIDYNRRPTAEEMLQHPFVKEL